MKQIFLSFIIGFSTLITNGQEKVFSDTTLKFNVNYYDCENKWVVIPKKKNAPDYAFGFIYMDSQAGITLDVEGAFKVDGNNKYFRVDTGPKVASYKYRLTKNTVEFELLSKDKIKELKLDDEPKWLDIYLVKDKLVHDILFGKHLNAIDECGVALRYLEKAYKIKPNADELEFELSYSYNALNRFSDAIKILEKAIKNRPKEILLYKELGYAQKNSKDYDNALKTFKQGIELCSDSDREWKSEMAYNMAFIYKQVYKDEEQFKNWAIKAKNWAYKDSNIYKQLSSMGI